MTAPPPSILRRLTSLPVVLVAAAAALFTLYYWAEPTRVLWQTYFDQSAYTQMAADLAAWHLPEPFWFGIGYPLVGVPSLWLGLDGDPFFLFNLFAFCFAAYATYRAGTSFVSRPAGAIAAGLLIFASPLVIYTTLPWNSTVVLVAISGLLLIAARPRLKLRHAIIAGLLVGWAFAARYADVAWVMPLALAAVYRQSLAKSLGRWLIIAGVSLAMALPVLYLHEIKFGSPFKTPYSQPERHIPTGASVEEAGAYDLKGVPSHFVAFFLSSHLVSGPPEQPIGLLPQMIWLIAALPGGYLLLRAPGYRRLFFATALGLSALAYVFYLSFYATGPGNLKYGLLHYFKPFWPIFAIAAAAAIVALWKRGGARR